MTDSYTRHIGVLDGLRAMAILLVLAEHSLDMAWLDMRQPLLPIGHFDLAAFLKNGWTGVDLFFVLSGFLITGQLLDGGISVNQGRREVIRLYLKRRICRIVPAYYLMLTFSTAVYMFFDPQARGVVQWAHSYILHLLFLQDFFYFDYNPVFWSLAVEFQFYMLAPFLILTLLRIRKPGRRYLALLSVILLLEGLRSVVVLHWQAEKPDFILWFWRVSVAFPFSLDGILGGMLCGFLWRDETVREILQRRYVSNSLFFGGLLLFLALTSGRPMQLGFTLFETVFMILLVSAAFSSMLLGLLAGSAGQRLFSSRPLRHVAIVSYSMYLVHMTIMRDVFDLTAPVTLRFHSPSVTYLVGLAAFVGITIGFSTLMYQFVEKPCMDWARKVPAKAVQK